VGAGQGEGQEGIPVSERWVGLFIAAAVVTAVSAVGVGTAFAGNALAESNPPKGQSVDKTVKFVTDDIQKFWFEQLPQVYGQQYQRIPDRRIQAYDSKTDFDRLSECSQGGDYQTFKDNAFVCASDLTVNWDAQSYVPGLNREFGTLGIGLLFAHEWGHVIQDETGDRPDESVIKETQADCFAGAWAARVNNGDSALKVKPGVLDEAVAVVLKTRDTPGGSATQEGAHGNGFDRVSSFQQGYNGGPQRCSQWQEDPPTITELPFSGAAEALTGGNLPLKDVIPTAKQDLDLYWGQFTFDGQPYKTVSDVISYNPKDKKSLPACKSLKLKPSDYKDTIFYCADKDFIAYDRNLVSSVYRDTGDFGVAEILGNAWASAMQSRLNIQSTDEKLGLQADCLSGSWVGSVPIDQDGTIQARGAPEDRQASFSLSPGDLDEVVGAFLIFGNPTGEAGSRGTAFERLDSFRNGFLNGEDACLAMTAG